MKLKLGCLITLLAMLYAHPVRAQSVGNLTAQSTACQATSSCIETQIPPNIGGATFKLSGTFTGTIQFEGTADPLNITSANALWVALSATPSNSSTTVTSATATGVWQVNIAAYTRVRIRVSAFGSGTVAAAINISSASARGGSGAGGGGSIASCSTAGGVAYENGTANTLTCESQLVWDTTTKQLTSGVPAASLNASVQTFVGNSQVIGRRIASANRTIGIGSIIEDDTDLSPRGGIFAAFTTVGDANPAITNTIIGMEADGLANNAANFVSISGVTGIADKGGAGSVGTGALGMTGGYFRTAISGGTVGDAMGLMVDGNNGTSIFGAAGGTITNEYGVRVTSQVNANATNEYAYYADVQGTGANDFVFYAAGGQSRLNAAGGQTRPVLDINFGSGAALGGQEVVRGAGITNAVEGGPALRQTVQIDDASILNALQSEAKPNSIAYDWISNTGGLSGSYIRAYTADNFTSTAYEEFPIGGAIHLEPDPGSTGLETDVAFTSPLYNTKSNCSDSAGAAACGSSAAGTVVVDAGATTVVVSTTAVTANSEIFVQYDSSLGTRLSVTCNVTVALPSITARTAGTSFTITVPVAPAVNPACYSFHIIN